MKFTKKPSVFEEARQIRKFFKIPKRERGIVFYAEHQGYWPAFQGLIGELNTKHHRTVWYITSDWSDPVLREENPRIRPVYVHTLLSLFMQLIDSPVVVMTLSDLNNHTIKRSRYSVHYIYVFHAIVSTHMVYSFGAFDHYDSVLCVGPHHVKEIRKREELYGLKQKKLVEAGYFRLERIMEAYERRDADATFKERKTVLVAPSWGDQNILETCGEEVVRILLNAGYRVIVRPHSETIKRFPGLIQRIEKEFSENPEFSLEKTNAGDESMIRANILISDSSGITLEYAFGTLRPVIFLDVPLKIKNARYQELGIEPIELALQSKIGNIVSLANLKSLPSVIDDMLAHQEDYKKNIVEARKESVFNIGISSKVGAEYLVSLLAA